MTCETPGPYRAVDARLLLAREPECAKEMLAGATESFVNSEAVEPAALATFQMLRFLTDLRDVRHHIGGTI